MRKETDPFKIELKSELEFYDNGENVSCQAAKQRESGEIVERDELNNDEIKEKVVSDRT